VGHRALTGHLAAKKATLRGMQPTPVKGKVMSVDKAPYLLCIPPPPQDSCTQDSRTCILISWQFPQRHHS
jgi:hypothetical protein